MMIGRTEVSKKPVGRLPRRTRAARLAEGSISIAVVFTLLTDVSKTITLSTGHFLFVSGGVDGRLPLSALPQLARADLRAGTQGTLADADLGLRLLAALPTLVHAVTITAGAVLLIGILYRVAVGEPFSRAVLIRWRWLTITLLAGGALQGLADTAASTYVGFLIAQSFSEAPGAHTDAVAQLGGDYAALTSNMPQWPVAILLAGVIALGLGMAFRSGALLEEAVDGVV